MTDYQYKKTSIVICPECFERIFIEHPIFPGQSVTKACRCGLIIIFRKPKTAHKVGPKELKENDNHEI